MLTHKDSDSPETAHIEQGIKIKPVTVGRLLSSVSEQRCPDPVTLELEEDGIRIALTIVDTPGFGDNIDNEYSCVQTCSSAGPY